MSHQKYLTKYGPWALVTGASSGIGKAIAINLGNRGFNLVLVGRAEKRLQETQQTIQKNQQIEVKTFALDLGSDGALKILATQTEGLDIGLYVASAGFGTSGLFIETNQKDEKDMLMVNCAFLMESTKLFSHRMVNRGSGGIILLSSIVGFQGMPNAAHYAATKSYVQTFGEALHFELKNLGVDVLVAAPGSTNSGFADIAGMKMGNALKPEHIADPILNSLGKRVTVLPGFLSKLLVYSLITLPRFFRIMIMGSVMNGMTKHRKSEINAKSPLTAN
ncbi:MAG: SDR family NAD(P)-dependent oxidoreductase [Cyanothece sp. SIO2G6]|nr:SDR family NAD(P)-dependent oxidoreductase [Cyanothece sp. SIO2G6]